MSRLEGIEKPRPRADLRASPPVFLVGAPRSGTSLLYRTLCLHPQAAYISNWLRRHPRRRALSFLNRIPPLLPQLQARYWFGEDSNAYRYGGRRSLVERLFPAPVEGAPVFEDSGLRDGGSGLPTPQEAAALRGAFAALSRYGGGTTVVSKRVVNNRRIPFLLAAFPDARFVSIVRDGRAVAYSLSRVDWWEGSEVWWFGGTPKQWRDAGGDPWELCARTWTEEVRAIEAGLAAVKPDQLLRIRYEDLVADPMVRFGEIASFAGLPESRQWLGGLRRLQFPNRNEAWRSKLEPETVRRIESFQAEELRRYEYL